MWQVPRAREEWCGQLFPAAVERTDTRSGRRSASFRRFCPAAASFSSRTRMSLCRATNRRVRWQHASQTATIASLSVRTAIEVSQTSLQAGTVLWSAALRLATAAALDSTRARAGMTYSLKCFVAIRILSRHLSASLLCLHCDSSSVPLVPPLEFATPSLHRLRHSSNSSPSSRRSTDRT